MNGEGGAVAEPSTEVPTEPLESPSKKVKVEGSDDEVVKGMEVSRVVMVWQAAWVRL